MSNELNDDSYSSLVNLTGTTSIFDKFKCSLFNSIAPVNAIVCTDVDGDNINDLLLAGNEYQAEVNTGRYDASYGCYLKGAGNGNFSTISPATSGFIVNGDVKDMKLVTTLKNQRLLLVAVNNDSLKVFRMR